MEKNNNEFLEYALKSGRIKPAQEAFEEYPPEEEIHKGNAYYYIKEKNEEYIQYSAGDIVFVRQYKYNNGKEGRDHLFVIIEKDNLLVPIEYLSMLISSKLDKIKYPSNILLKKDNINNLSKDSIVKTDIIYQIKERDILLKIGTVEIDTIEEYKKSFMKYKE